MISVKSVRRLGMGITDHYIDLCKIKFVGPLIERKEVGRIISVKLCEEDYKEKYESTYK